MNIHETTYKIAPNNSFLVSLDNVGEERTSVLTTKGEDKFPRQGMAESSLPSHPPDDNLR